MARVAVVVIDACGIGGLDDAADYGDTVGFNTLANVAEAVGGLRLPVLQSLGLGSIVPLRGVSPASSPVVHGRLAAQGFGKDSTAGHWELMGVAADVPPPTYPDGFSPQTVAELERVTGLQFLCNAPANGLAVIEQFGEEHLRTGKPILYTSQDSVLQLAAHVDRVALEDLYAACAAAREVVDVIRVIARPFEGEPGAFSRTTGRHDLALPPPGRSALDVLVDRGVPIHAVGKVNDLFGGRAIDVAHPGATNATSIASTTSLLATLDHGFVFANLIETDQLFGHRHDAEGFHRALREIDAAVGGWLELLREDDVLILTADHGVDPTAPHTDHTREYAPLIAATGSRPPRSGHRHDGVLADVGQTVVTHLTGRPADELPGRSVLDGGE
jgi:phosphopentomutase